VPAWAGLYILDVKWNGIEFLQTCTCVLEIEIFPRSAAKAMTRDRDCAHESRNILELANGQHTDYSR
jgi:hypothetical protein